MNYILDAHTHTIVSGHAFNTIDEMVQEAKNKGLKLLGITEHASDMPGSCHPYYFSNLPCIKKYYNKNELIVLFGCEGNIIEENGIYTLDILRDNFTSQCVDYIIASMHKCCFPPKNKNENTKAFLDVMNTGRVNILGHIDDGNFELDYEEIIKCAKKNKVVIELNNSSNSPIGFRINAHNLDLIYLELCKKYNVPIVLNSDAHCRYDILNFEYILPILKEVNFPDELILNTSTDKFIKYAINKEW